MSTKTQKRASITTTTQATYPFQSDYTVKEIARILKIAVASVRKLMRSGDLKHYKISERGTRVTQKQLDEFRGRKSWT